MPDGAGLTGEVTRVGRGSRGSEAGLALRSSASGAGVAGVGADLLAVCGLVMTGVGVFVAAAVTGGVVGAVTTGLGVGAGIGSGAASGSGDVCTGGALASVWAAESGLAGELAAALGLRPCCLGGART